jgi:DNA polymerase
MMQPFLKSLGADCDSCPFVGQPHALAERALSPTRIWIVGESPNRTEANKGRPFVGEAGGLLNGLLAWAGAPREAVTITNSILCLPAKHATDRQKRAASMACAPRLDRELTGLTAKSLVITMGRWPMVRLTGKDLIRDWRGYPLPAPGLPDGIIVFPMWHPAYVLQFPHLLPTLKLDMQRALAIHSGRIQPWVWPQIEIHEGEEMVRILQEIIKEGRAGIDVETAGTNPYASDLLCVGVAGKAGAVSIPYPFKTGHLRDLVHRILSDDSIMKVFHNGAYDAAVMRTWHMPLAKIGFDTMIAHRLLAPQQPHDLGYVASCFFPAPRWKSEHKVGDDRKGSERWAIARSDGVRYMALRTYNAKDAWMTHALSYAMEAML